MKDGLVGRGVLLDVARLRSVDWLEPGEHIFSAELEEAQREQGVRVEEGDVVLVRTGHANRLEKLKPWDPASAKAGLHPSCATFQRHGAEHDRFVAAPLRISGGTGSPLNPIAVR